jgi:ribosomal protein S18 acetylase RimI-like enzyme
LYRQARGIVTELWHAPTCLVPMGLRRYRDNATIRPAMDSLTERVVLRPATEGDLPDIVRIKYCPPEPPFARLLGEERATRLGELLVLRGGEINVRAGTIAVVDGASAGLLVCGSELTVGPDVGGLLPLLRSLLRILGIVTPRAVYGLWLRNRLQFKPVPDAFSVTELYVDENMRNRGIGGRLLRHADELALREGAPRMSIETGITNPARRLYERHGYTAIAEKASVAYERVTDSPGRVLMVKEL